MSISRASGHFGLVIPTLLLLALAAACGESGGASSDDEEGPSDDLLVCEEGDEGVTPGDPIDFEPSDGAADGAPAPPSIGADVPLTYFGPPPSSVNPNLVGPHQLLTSGPLDLSGSPATITLPLYRGQIVDEEGGETPLWFVLTDTTDLENARALGLNHAAKLVYALAAGATIRRGWYESDGSVTFSGGTVDFSPEHQVAPGEAPNIFPPSVAQPGSVGDADYTPLVVIENAGGHVYNAPVIAFGVDEEALDFCQGDPDFDVVHDKVVRLCPEDGTVTLALTPGFSFGKPVLYLSLEANVDVAAALEGATYAPALSEVPVGRDDSAFSAVERIFVVINGPSGSDHPHRQGLVSALLGEGSPLNTLGGIPTVATDYSPLWDVNMVEWTEDAIESGYRARVFEEFQILGLVQRGHLTGPGGQAFGSTGIIVNCPIVHRFL